MSPTSLRHAAQHRRRHPREVAEAGPPDELLPAGVSFHRRVRCLHRGQIREAGDPADTGERAGDGPAEDRLVAGEPGEAKDQLTQAVNWNAWPTTFFAGRDGRVRKVHAGFPSRASGTFYQQATEEFTAAIEQLIAEPLPKSH